MHADEQSPSRSGWLFSWPVLARHSPILGGGSGVYPSSGEAKAARHTPSYSAHFWGKVALV